MKRLELLDYGRFFAAVIVVLFHYTFNGVVNGKISSISNIQELAEITKYGYLGVELFFMISGYVIFFSAINRTPSEFALSRAVRLYPAYWFAILFTSLFAVYWGGDLMSVDLTKVVANFTMFQFSFGVGDVDAVYWTLAFEVSFYVGVYLLLLMGLQRNLHTLFTYWPIAFCVALLFGKDSLPYLGGYFYYFSAGALFGVLKQKPKGRVVVGLVVVFVLCVSFSAGKAPELTESKGIEFSEATIGLIVTSFFILFLYQNTSRGQALKLPMSRLFGGLTYPIYLVHCHFGYMVISRFATEGNKLFVYMITFILVLIVALFIHKVIEVKFAVFWKTFFIRLFGGAVGFVEGASAKFQMVYNRRK